MKSKISEVNERRLGVFNLIQNEPNRSISELANYFNVAEITIRRDLKALEKKGLIECFFGGFKVLESRTVDLKERSKKEIAKFAASLVKDNDVIFINTSSTALGLIPFITAKDVTVVTNNGNAINMDFPENVHVYLTGGEIRNPKGSLVGDFALRIVSETHVSKCFLGCSGLSPKTGMTTLSANEVSINIKMIENADFSTYIMADYSKLGMVSNFVSVPTDYIKNIITDTNASEAVVAEFRDKGINILFAEKK